MLGPIFAPRDQLGGYRIQEAIAAGGMGRVYRAETASGDSVALKVVPIADAAARARFDREADALMSIHHDGVVRLKARSANSEVAWLAMEWLDGVHLGRYMAQHGSTPHDAQDWGRQLASALDAVHRAGLVHRDLKPSNVQRRPDGRLVLLDFGIVESVGGTQHNALAGTPGYMAPEQARGAGVDARSDLFSLGCLLFEAAAGRPAFAGQYRVATLARVILDDVPRVRELRPDVPAALDDAIARLLSKRPEQRPGSAAEVVDLLTGSAPAAEASRPRRSTSARLGQDELLLASVIVAASQGDAATVTGPLADVRAVERIADRAGARLEMLADGTQLLSVAGTGNAGDCVRRAAEAVLALQRVLPGAALSLATGRANVAGRWPVGEAVDTAVSQLHGRAPGAPLIDELSKQLLRGNAVLSEDGERLLSLTVEAHSSTLFGRAALLSRCRERLKQSSHLALVGPAGIGKSHLSRTLQSDLTRAGLRCVNVRAAALGRAVPHAITRQVALALLRCGEGQAARQLARRFEATPLTASEAARHVAALSFVLGAESQHPLLSALRRAPQQVDEAVGDAWRAWLKLECADQALAIFVDDAQWCDEPSRRLLLSVAESRYCCVWPSRPPLFPAANIDVLDVPPLERSAAAQLVRSVSPSRVADPSELIDQADGNPLFLEELARADLEDGARRRATTALAILQARFGALPEPARRLLRAASVFGRDFERAALPHLLGNEFTGARLERSLAGLRESGVLAASEQRGSGDLQFRHDLWRDAAYGSFTKGDRQRGHQLAAQFLQGRPDTPPALLAAHYESAGDRRQASHWWVRASEAAFAAGDQAAAEAHLELADEVAGPDAGRALRVRAELALWNGNMKAALDAATQAMELLPRGEPWRRAVGIAVQSQGRLGKAAALHMTRAHCHGDQWLTCQLARELVRVGDTKGADELIAELAASEANDFAEQGELASLRAARALCAGDYFEQLGQWQRALVAYEALGQRALACATRGEIGFTHWLLGDATSADAAIQHALQEAEALGSEHVRAWLLCIWGPVLGEIGDLERAVAIEREALTAFEALDDPRLTGACCAYLSLLEQRRGDQALARETAQRALRLLTPHPPLQSLALAAAGRVALAEHDTDACLTLEASALELLNSDIELEEGEALLQLVLSELYDRAGRTAQAEAIAIKAATELERRAGAIGSPEARWRFLNSVTEHRGLLERAGRTIQRPPPLSSSNGTARSDC